MIIIQKQPLAYHWQQVFVEAFYWNRRQHMLPVRAASMASKFQSRFLSHPGSSLSNSAHVTVLLLQHDPVYHLQSAEQTESVLELQNSVYNNGRNCCFWERGNRTYLFTVSNGSLLLSPFCFDRWLLYDHHAAQFTQHSFWVPFGKWGVWGLRLDVGGWKL